MSLILFTKDVSCEDDMDDLGKKRLLDVPPLSGRPLGRKRRENVSPNFNKKTLNENKAIKLNLYFITCEWQTCN